MRTIENTEIEYDYIMLSSGVRIAIPKTPVVVDVDSDEEDT